MTNDTTGAEGAAGEGGAPTPEGQVRPGLSVSGVVLTKAQLLEALSAFVPNVTDFVPLPDGEHFSILFGSNGRRT